MDLDKRWSPLEQISENPILTAHLSDSGCTTIGKTIYVKNLQFFLSRHSGAAFEAVLAHEQAHAIRQERDGLFIWVVKYLFSKDFALEEEKIGWYYEIKILGKNGIGKPPEHYASRLDNYWILTGDLIEYEEALKWVNEVIQGRWNPEN